MRTTATKADIKRLVASTRELGWEVCEEKEKYSHIVQLKSPLYNHGMWHTITVCSPEHRPRVVTHSSYSRKRNRGLWHADYVVGQYREHVAARTVDAF